MLKYTGHPLVDVGAATIAAFVGKEKLASVTEADLDKVADFIEREYPREPLKSFLGVAFTTNAWFNQPAFNSQPEKKTEYSRRLLRGYRQEVLKSNEKCTFTGNPAIAIAFSDKLPAGRAFRQHIPMLTGEGVINFFPWGNAGLPVSGEAILCIQASPLGCAKCGGKLLAVHSDNPDIIYEFAQEFLDANRKALSLAHQSDSKKLTGAKMSARTLLIDTLLAVEQRRRDEQKQLAPFSATAYYFSNSGQSNPLDSRNPPLEIYHLPLELTDFLRSLNDPDYKAEWSAIAQRAWWLSQNKKRKGEEDTSKERPQRNVLYEDLLRLPEGARTFVRRYFLRIPARRSSAEDPRRGYSLKDEAGLVSWKLTELFLRKVMSMDKERIQQIRELGDRLAAYVHKENDRPFFTKFRVRDYLIFRNKLIRANNEHVKRGNPPLIPFDSYITVFEDGDELQRSDWRLARDLVLIRMVEELYRLGWLGSNPDAMPEDLDEETSQG